jgi:WD40 repeat protein
LSDDRAAPGVPPPRVFVSYTHDSEHHKEQVLRFCAFLREHGVDAELDQWFTDRRRDWYTWAIEQTEAADFVIVVASPAYRRAGDGAVPAYQNRGAQSEAALLRDRLHGDRTEWLPKLIPVLLPGYTTDDIPLFLQPYTADHYTVTDFTLDGAEDLLRLLTAQPRHSRPPIGPRPVFAEPSPKVWRLSGDRDFQTHWLPRARGVEPDAERSGWYFVGRRRALREIAGWLAAPGTDRDRKMLVVTGTPGSGKSALISHTLVLADRELRSSAPSLYKRELPEDVVGSVDVAVHARGKDVGAVCHEIAAAAGVAASTPQDLFAALAERGRPMTIVLDALDEAVPDDISPLSVMLKKLARDPDGIGLRVLVGVRSAVADSPLDTWVRQLGRRKFIIAVDEAPYLETADVATYVYRRLLLDGHLPDHANVRPGGGQAGRASTPYQDDPELARRVARAVTERSRGNFLIAQLVSRFLAEDSVPVDVSREGWSTQFPDTVDEALAEYFARFGDLRRQRWVRDLLTPLAFAAGDGLPDNALWTSLASALSRPAARYTVSDVHELLDTAATYLVYRGLHQGRRTYRLYHGALDQYLRGLCRIPDRQAVVAETLAGCVPVGVPVGDDSVRDWRAADPYLRRHLAEHAAAAGTGMLETLTADPAFLIHAEPAPLIRVLSRVQRTGAGAAARVYQLAAHRLGAEVSERAAYLSMAAHQLDELALAASVEQACGSARWYVTACEWTPLDDYQVVMSLDPTTTVTALNSSAPGHLVVVAGDAAGNVQLHRWVDGIAEPGDPHKAHQGAVTASAVIDAPDGRQFALTGARDGGLRLWHIDDDLLIPVGAGSRHRGEVSAVSFGTGPLGHRQAIPADRTGLVTVWRVTEEELVKVWERGAEDDWQVTAVALAVDRTGHLHALAGGVDGRLRMWQSSNEAAVRQSDIVLEKRWGLGDSAIGAVALRVLEGQVAAFVVTGYGHLHRFRIDADGHHKAADAEQAQNVGISALWAGVDDRSGQRPVLATGSVNGDITLLYVIEGNDAVTGNLNLYQQLRPHHAKVNAVLLTPGRRGELFVTSSADDRQIATWQANAEPQPLTGLWDSKDSGIALATACGGGPYPAMCLIRRERHTSARRATEFWALTGSGFVDLTEPVVDDGSHPVMPTVTIEGLQTHQYPIGRQWLENESSSATLLSFSAMTIHYLGGRYIVATASPVGKLILYELTESTAPHIKSRTLGSNEGQPYIESMAISGDSRRPRLVTGAAEGKLDLWRIDGSTLDLVSPPTLLTGPGPRLSPVQVSHGRQLLVAGDSLGTITLLALVDGQIVATARHLGAHDRPITALTAIATKTGDLLTAVGDLGGHLTLWRLGEDGSAEPVTHLRLGSPVACIAFTDPRHSVVWCREGGMAIRWNIELPA